MRFLGPHSAGEGPHLVPISLKFGSPSGPHFEKSGSPGLVGTVDLIANSYLKIELIMFLVVVVDYSFLSFLIYLNIQSKNSIIIVSSL